MRVLHRGLVALAGLAVMGAGLVFMGSGGSMAASVSVTDSAPIFPQTDLPSPPSGEDAAIFEDGAFVSPITVERVLSNPQLFDFSNPRFQIEPVTIWEEPVKVWDEPVGAVAVPNSLFTSTGNFSDGGDAGAPRGDYPEDELSSMLRAARDGLSNALLSTEFRNDLNTLGLFETITGVRIRTPEERGADSAAPRPPPRIVFEEPVDLDPGETGPFIQFIVAVFAGPLGIFLLFGGLVIFGLLAPWPR